MNHASSPADGHPVDGHPVVYVIEDDAVVRHSLEQLLQALGHATRGFSSANDFLDSFHASQQYGCLIADVRLPGMDGLELFDVLAVEKVRIPVIFLTGDRSPDLREIARERGIVAVLEKPCSADKLQKAIEAALRDDADRKPDRNS